MQDRLATGRYSTLSITVHWLTLALLVGVYACIELRELFPKGSDPRNALKMWHFMLGLSVLVLVAIRVVARLLRPAPPILPDPARWQKTLAAAMHIALYALMIGMPIAGWLILSAEGEPIPFFGFELPALTGENEALAEQVEELHGTVGELGYYLIGLHTLAALFHHYRVKDNTLLRMLPGRSR